MVQINKYNAINSIKTTASQNLKKLRGRANRGKEQDYNKRDVKRGGGGRWGITCTRAEACCQAAQIRIRNLGEKVLVIPQLKNNFQGQTNLYM